MENEFVKIRNMGDRATFGITEGEVEASEKLDGCFSYETLISTNIGALAIGSIVNKKLDVLVKSFNKDTNLIEYKPIINFWKNGSGTNWIELVIESEKGLKHITMTDNHKVFDGNIFKPISNFNIGDNVYISTPLLGGISPFKIISMSKTTPRYNQKYDIEVADNHNYFANGMLVSNSNFSWYVKEEDGTLVFRSHHTILGGGLENGAAWKLAVQLITNAHAKTPFKTGYMYFGESMCKPHRINYGDAISPFYGFAVFNLQYGIYVKNWKKIMAAHGIPTVPTIMLQNPTVAELKALIDLPSIVAPNVKREGMVYKNYLEQKFAKIVADEFKERAMQKIVPVNEERKFLDQTPEIVETYCNYARVAKRVHEFCDESGLDLGMQLMPKIMPIVERDILTECIIEISEKFTFMDFTKFHRLVAASCARHLKRVIEESFE